MEDTNDTTGTEGYVSRAEWHAPGGRPELIDEVADQFERRPEGSAAAFWTRSETGWHLGRLAT